MTGARRLALFVSIPLLNGLSTLLAIPAVTQSFGAQGWEAIAIGFAIGAAAAIVIELGWGVVGPLRVARARTAAHGTAYLWSLKARIIVLVPAASLAAVVTALLVPHYRLEASAMSVAAALVGLSPTWFFTGTGQPARILLADSLPRIAAVATSVLALHLGLPLLVYPSLLVVAGAISPAVGWLFVRRASERGPRLSLRRTLVLIRLQLGVLGGRAALALYTSTPISLVALAAPGSLAVYSAADRLMRSGLQFLNSVNLQLTGWVGRKSSRAERDARARSAITISVVVAACAGIICTLATPGVSRWLFSGVADVTLIESTLLGIIVFVTVVANAVSRLLVVRARISTVNVAMWIRLGASCIGVVAGAVTLGTAGALAGLLFGELVSFIFQVWVSWTSRPPRAN